MLPLPKIILVWQSSKNIFDYSNLHILKQKKGFGIVKKLKNNVESKLICLPIICAY